ncbi:MAG: exodeoxyribonuclease V subunit beta [Methylococcaceae bacterium]
MTSLNSLTLPLQGTHLIEASAGTGKTFTIAALYVRLILGHEIEMPLMPQSILVVTFTDAATEELRDRIRSRLSKSAQYFRGQIENKDVDDFLIDLRKSCDAKNLNRNMCAKRLEVAANYMDEAAVFTIHSWCNRMLQQHAFDSGSPFKQDVNTDDSELINNVIRDYWRVHFYGLDKNQCEFIVKHLAKSPDDFAGQIQNLLKETEALKLDNFQMQFVDIFVNWTKWKKENDDFENIAKESWINDFNAINDLLNQANLNSWLNGNKYKKNTFDNKRNEINNWAIKNQSCDLKEIAKFGLDKLTDSLVKAHKDKAVQFYFLAFQAIDDFVNHGDLEQAGEIVKNIKLHAIKWIRNRYAQEKKKLSRVTFEDMLSNLDNALQGKNASRLAEIIRNQYPVALIDEFQDTDPIQYRIFSTIYQNQSSTSCFLIGDPKQAIYSFRGADIYTYLKAHQATQNHHTLKTNFRSTQALIDALNQLFHQAEKNAQGGAFLFGNTGNNPLPYVPVKANGLDDNLHIDNKLASALTFWTWQEDKISIEFYREQIAKVTASEIVKLLANETAGFQSEEGFKKLELKDIAILVRTGKEAKIIRRELSRRNLKSVYLSEQDSIYDTDEAGDVLIWLEAMANPRNEGKVRTAVSTGTLGFSKERLFDLTLDDVQWETHLERFQTYQTCWQESGILPALRLLIHDYGLHLNSKNDNESERKLTNVLHLTELLQQHSSKIEGEEALIHHFAQLLESKNQRSAKNNIIRLESDSNLIQIITIHKSKGLEYPLVFLPFVSDVREVSKKENYFKYHDEDKDLCIDLDTTDKGKENQTKEQLQEDLRILYVALTRAKYACWLGIASTNRLAQSAIGHLIGNIANLEKVKGECNSIEIVTLPEPTNDSFISQTENDSTGSVRESKVNTRENWWAASYSALKRDYKKQRGESTEAATAQEYVWGSEDNNIEFSIEESNNADLYGLPKGAKPGVLLHALFEQCGNDGFAHAHKNEKWRKDAIDKIFTGNLWDEKRDVICHALPKWLEMPLVQDARFIDLEKSQYQTELEFLIGVGSVKVATLDLLIKQFVFSNETRPTLPENQLNGYLKGFIDLVFCHDNKYYVVDYKSDYLGNTQDDYSESKIKKTMLDKRFDLQYSLYLLALHRLLKLRLGESYDYDKHIGGAIYVFLRANAKISDKPSREFIEQLDALFLGENHG